MKDKTGSVAQTGFHYAQYDWKPREEIEREFRLGK